jgi:hypothetical protein
VSEGWRLVRETYRTTMKARRDDTAAYQRAVEVLMAQEPNLKAEEARREVATMLALEPTDDEETGV